MATITFFEKTGCINNTKQKQILSAAGHTVKAIDLIQHQWTAEELLGFFDELPVKDWFNKNAPKVASGEIIPERFSAESALEALLNEHLLIRRPLLIVEGEKMVGFDKSQIDSKIGLSMPTGSKFGLLMNENLDDCPQKDKGYQC